MKNPIDSFFLAALSHAMISFGQQEIDPRIVLQRYPEITYQDVVVKNKVLMQGLNLCDIRYNLIKPVLDLFPSQFSVLDLGAAQGYFSFRIAHDYPQAHCTMIDENSSDYRYHGDLLYDLCLLNQMDRVTYLRKRMCYHDLCFLNHREHFDVVLVFLVMHQMGNTLSEQQMLFERILSLGDHVIVEVADDVAVDLTQFVGSLCERLNGECLGEVFRFQNPKLPGKGLLYWFKGSATTHRHKINQETFRALNGVYPHAFVD